MTATAAAVLIFDERNRLLILRRGPTALWMPRKWGLPGGQREQGEQLARCAVRETKEETGIILHGVRPLIIIRHVTELWSCAFFVALRQDWFDSVRLNCEHDLYAWIYTSDVDHFDFVPTVVAAIKEATA